MELEQNWKNAKKSGQRVAEIMNASFNGIIPLIVNSNSSVCMCVCMRPCVYWCFCFTRMLLVICVHDTIEPTSTFESTLPTKLGYWNYFFFQLAFLCIDWFRWCFGLEYAKFQFFSPFLLAFIYFFHFTPFLFFFSFVTFYRSLLCLGVDFYFSSQPALRVSKNGEKN